MATTALDDAYSALAAAIAGERDAAETLAYRLATVRLLLDAGEPELLTQGLTELELAAARVEAAGRRRRQATEDLAGPLGLGPESATLERLAQRSPARWSVPLTRERDALAEIVERIREEAGRHRRRAEQALDDVRQRLGAGDGGRRRHLEPLPNVGERQLAADLQLAELVTELRVREVTYEALIDVTTSLLPPDLVRFVEGGPRLMPRSD